MTLATLAAAQVASGCTFIGMGVGGGAAAGPPTHYTRANLLDHADRVPRDRSCAVEAGGRSLVGRIDEVDGGWMHVSTSEALAVIPIESVESVSCVGDRRIWPVFVGVLVGLALDALAVVGMVALANKVVYQDK